MSAACSMKVKNLKPDLSLSKMVSADGLAPAVMRLFPAVVLNARVANKDSIMPSGGGMDGQTPVLVGTGDIVVFSTWARHRLGDDFGENPQAFYPERWEQLSGDMPGFIPFNKGPRACPGRRMISSLGDCHS